MSKMASTTSLQPRCDVAMPVTTTHHVKPRRACCAAAVTGSAATASVAVAMACTPAAVAAPAERARMSTRRSAASSVAQMWRKVQGSGDWDGLLEPLHPVLRNELARYGELVGACYEALDIYPSSARYMNCKYGKERMLEKAGLAGAGYEVTRYIYAAPDVSLPAMDASTSGPASWVGYVAVTTDEQTRRLGRRDVLVSFRGTVTQAEWVANLMSSLEPARLDPSDPRPDVKVESGFLNLYTSADKACRIVGAGSCREQLLREVSRLITSHYKNHPGEDMSVTLAGHSMGSALAMLLAYDLAELDLNRDASESRVPAPVTVFSFGGPRVGNAAFKARCDELGVKALRVSNVRDPVTKLPGVFLNEGTTRGLLGAWSGACYTHVGVELALDFIRFRDLGSVHDLGTYVASLKAEADGEVANAEAGAEGSILTKAMEFVEGHSAGALSWHWQDAALQMGGLVHSIGLI